MVEDITSINPTKRTFVTGWPISHSRSPIIHNYWIKQHGLEGAYERLPKNPSEFGAFLTTLADSDFVGGNVTIPHKEAAFQLVDQSDELSSKLEAVNTVWIEEGILHGSNTDGYGFLANLDDRCPGWDAYARKKRGALVLGAGGAARAIIYGLVSRGFDPVIISNRTVERAETLATKFGPVCRAVGTNIGPQESDVSLVINTTSLGMSGEGNPLDVSGGLTGFKDDLIMNDIVYTPLITPLLRLAKEKGMVAVDGLGMLLHQAVPGFEKWFGVRPKVSEELRALVIENLEKEI